MSSNHRNMNDPRYSHLFNRVSSIDVGTLSNHRMGPRDEAPATIMPSSLAQEAAETQTKKHERRGRTEKARKKQKRSETDTDPVIVISDSESGDDNANKVTRPSLASHHVPGSTSAVTPPNKEGAHGTVTTGSGSASGNVLASGDGLVAISDCGGDMVGDETEEEVVQKRFIYNGLPVVGKPHIYDCFPMSEFLDQFARIPATPESVASRALVIAGPQQELGGSEPRLILSERFVPSTEENRADLEKHNFGGVKPFTAKRDRFGFHINFRPSTDLGFYERLAATEQAYQYCQNPNSTFNGYPLQGIFLYKGYHPHKGHPDSVKKQRETYARHAASRADTTQSQNPLASSQVGGTAQPMTSSRGGGTGMTSSRGGGTSQSSRGGGTGQTPRGGGTGQTPRGGGTGQTPRGGGNQTPRGGGTGQTPRGGGGDPRFRGRAGRTGDGPKMGYHPGQPKYGKE